MTLTVLHLRFKLRENAFHIERITKPSIANLIVVLSFFEQDTRSLRRVSDDAQFVSKIQVL